MTDKKVNTKVRRDGKPVMVWLPNELAAQIEEYRWQHRHATMRAALLELLANGLRLPATAKQGSVVKA